MCDGPRGHTGAVGGSGVGLQGGGVVCVRVVYNLLLLSAAVSVSRIRRLFCLQLQQLSFFCIKFYFIVFVEIVAICIQYASKAEI